MLTDPVDPPLGMEVTKDAHSLTRTGWPLSGRGPGHGSWASNARRASVVEYHTARPARVLEEQLSDMGKCLE